MKKNLLAGLVAGLFMFGMNVRSEASPLYLTFQVESAYYDVGINGSDYIGKQYIFMIKVDDHVANASLVDSNGDVIYYEDKPQHDYFYVEPVASNHVSGNGTSISGVRQYNLGIWSAYDNSKETVWGTGTDYGTFSYRNRVSLYTENDADKVSVDGFWSDKIWPPIHPDSWFAEGALWMIGDQGYYPNGVVMRAGFFAELVNISETDPTIPIPATILLLASGLIGLVGIRRKKK